MNWKTKAEDKVRLVFLDKMSGEEITVSSDFPVENGTPIDEDGNDMEYIRTEVKEKEDDRLVQLSDDDGIILLCRTDMSDDQIEEASMWEAYDEQGYDYEEKLEAYAKMQGKSFERIYVDEVNV